MTEQTPTVGRSTPELERAAFDFEHDRYYRALETPAQLAELAGHLGDAAVLRGLRRTVAKHIDERVCS